MGLQLSIYNYLQLFTHRTDSSSRGREVMVQEPGQVRLEILQVGEDWADHDLGDLSNCSERDHLLRGCCCSSSGCSWACSQDTRPPPSDDEILLFEIIFSLRSPWSPVDWVDQPSYNCTWQEVDQGRLLLLLDFHSWLLHLTQVHARILLHHLGLLTLAD